MFFLRQKSVGAHSFSVAILAMSSLQLVLLYRKARARLATTVLLRCPQLCVIDLRGAHAYTHDETIELISGQAQCLESLFLGGCQALTKDGLANLTAESCPCLQVNDS